MQIAPFTIDISVAIDTLKAGGLIGLPTETVYGLAADASDAEAVASIFKLKERPSQHPLILHVADTPDAWKSYTTQEHPLLDVLANACWPGPMTLIVSKHENVSPFVTGGKSTVGLRIPQHPFAQALLREGAFALAAPSANRFGQISPTSALHVWAEFKDSPLLNSIPFYILDGGACAIGLESTIVDASALEHNELQILRLGHYPLDFFQALAAPFGVSVRVKSPNLTLQAPTRASGTYARHYAPRTPSQLIHVGDFEDVLWTWSKTNPSRPLGVLAFHQQPEALPFPIHWQEASQTPDAYGQELYARLRELDALGCAQLLIESPPQSEAWLTVLDRLTRATHPVS
jgi:L-threonylcarbamoyladenylate synthase